MTLVTLEIIPEAVADWDDFFDTRNLMNKPERKKQFHTLRLVLGDQLNSNHSWFKQKDAGVAYLIAELPQELDYVRHHIQKLCAFFAAMEAFVSSLDEKGHLVIHLTLDETSDFSDLTDLLASFCKKYDIRRFEYQFPDEYRLRRQLQNLVLAESIDVEAVDTEHFLLPEAEFETHIAQGKHNRMETFYRKMRKRLDLLMDADQPLGGKWNFDNDNREKLKPADLAELPEPLTFSNNVESILDRRGSIGLRGSAGGTRRCNPAFREA